MPSNFRRKPAKLLLRKVEKISDVLNSLEDLGIRIFIDDHNAVSFLKEQLEILDNENLKSLLK